MNEVRILIVEDEKRIANVIQKQLQESGFAVEVACDGYVGKEMIKQNHFDLVVLDINLPLINGYDLCKEIRKTNDRIPIIMLTALGTPENKLFGFDAGADDYVLKPFDFRELLARINVCLKRSNLTTQSRILRIADFEMDLDNKSASRSGKKIELTTKEFSLMETLLKNRNKVLTREFIIEHVWNLDFETGTNIIDVYMNYLRKKVDKGFELKIIHTKFGFGFYCSEGEI
jgi:two-component system, OmpR family, copper resistance phosphate regulon response regulator CusR